MADARGAAFFILYFYQRRKFSALLASVGLVKSNLKNGILWAILLGLGLSFLQLFFSRHNNEIFHLLHSGRAVILFPLVLLLMFSTAGFTEEFFFRGFLQTRLEKLLRCRLGAIGVTAILFGVYHLPYAYLNPKWPSHGNWSEAFASAMGQGLPLGLILGVMYARTRNNLLSCIILHSLINVLPGMTMIKIPGL